MHLGCEEQRPQDWVRQRTAGDCCSMTGAGLPDSGELKRGCAPRSVTMVEPQALTDRAAYSPHWDTTLTQHMAKRASIAGMTVRTPKGFSGAFGALAICS